MVFLDELVPLLVFPDFLDILFVTSQRPLLFYSNAGWEVFGMLERAGQVTNLRLELVDRSGFDGWGSEVVGSLTLEWMFGGTSRR